MKKALLYLLFAVSLINFTSCSSDSDDSASISLDKNSYFLLSEADLEVKVKVSAPQTTDITVGLNFSGSAEMDKDYTVSGQSVTIKAGQTSASLIISPKDNFKEGKIINIALAKLAGFGFGSISSTAITVQAKEELTFAFVNEYGLVSSYYDLEVDISSSNSSYATTADLSLPVEIDASSTAVLGTHFSFEGDKAEVVIPAGKKKGKLRINFIAQEDGKDKLVLKFAELGERFVPGLVVKSNITIVGNETKAKVIGKWKYIVGGDSKLVDYYTTNYPASDMENYPNKMTEADIIEFVAGEDYMTLKSSLKAGLKNYFVDNSKFTFKVEETVPLQEYGFPAKRVQLSKYTADKVNYKFSANEEQIKEATVAMRVYEEEGKELLEISVMDATPVDFFAAVLDFDATLSYNHIRYYFERIVE
ncbi:MAG: hypothetical protein N4A49_13310 [Marinifilaceae bacterium]|jgi:hypothetical protein|nr:hypothetical protein [Marinifilaceae bacterium]